jgi:hypothetical protein
VKHEVASPNGAIYGDRVADISLEDLHAELP